MRKPLEQVIDSLPAAAKKSKHIVKTIKREVSFAIGSIPFIWQVIFFYIPLFFLLVLSVTEYTELKTFSSLTLKHFRPIFNTTYFAIIGNSFILSLTNTLLCLAIGFPLAYFIAFYTRRFKSLWLFLLIIPFWTNFILHIYAWCFVLEKHGFLNNILLNFGLIKTPLHILNSHTAIIIMMVYFYLPFMVLPIFSALERFDTSLIEASLDLGAGRCKTLTRILLPLSMNAIRAGVFLVYIPSFGEFVIPELMGGDKTFFVGNVISLFVLGQKTAPVGIAFTVLSALALFISLCALNIFINKITNWLSGGYRARSH